jgi:hypothetical protein
VEELENIKSLTYSAHIRIGIQATDIPTCSRFKRTADVEKEKRIRPFNPTAQYYKHKDYASYMQLLSQFTLTYLKALYQSHHIIQQSIFIPSGVIIFIVDV